MRTKAINPQAKQKFLDAAQELMLAKGFAATSLDEICRKAGLTKGCFFHYFEGKDALGKEVLERFCCSSRKAMQEGCCCQDKLSDPLKRIYTYIDYVIDMSAKSTANKGCLIGAFAQELSDTHPKMRSMCAQGFDAWAKILKDDISAAKAKYASKAAFDPKELADHCIAILEGSQVLAKAKQDRKIIAKNMKHFKQYLKSLFGR